MITRFNTNSSRYVEDNFTGFTLNTQIPATVNWTPIVRVDGVQTDDFRAVVNNGLLQIKFNNRQRNVRVEVRRNAEFFSLLYTPFYSAQNIEHWLDSQIQAIQDLAINRHLAQGVQFLFAAGVNAPYLSSGRTQNVVTSVVDYIRNFYFFGKKTLSELLQLVSRAMFNIYTGAVDTERANSFDSVNFSLKYYAPISSFLNKSIDVNLGTFKGSFIRSMVNDANGFNIVLGRNYGRFMSLSTTPTLATLYVGKETLTAQVSHTQGQVTLSAPQLAEIDITTSLQPISISLGGDLIPMQIEPLIPDTPVVSASDAGSLTTLNEWLTS